MSSHKVSLYLAVLLGATCVIGWAQVPPQPIPLPSLPKSQSPPRLINPSGAPNFGFSAVPVGSLSVTLSWQAVPGATGFVVYRDGNVIGSLPPTTFAFVDRTVKPFGRYSYHLLASGLTQVVNGHSTVIPVGSPTIVVDVPPPLVPNGFSAQLIGASVKLTWNPVLEASAYEIDFGGHTVRVPSNAPPSVTDSAPNNRDASYAIRTLVQASDGSVTAGYWSNRLTIRVRPFVLVVAGDSIMWGQGLSTPHKFSSMFRQYLASVLSGRSLQVFDHSHSGAILGLEPDVDNATGHAEVTSVVTGEIPDSYPSIPRQALVIAQRDLQTSRLQPDDVDLVLIDGCINDVDVGTLLNPTAHDNQIASVTVDYCNRRMSTTLSQIHSAYKNAKVLVTSYYTIVSLTSDPLWVYGWVGALGFVPAVAPVGAIAAPAVWTAAVGHSKTFFNASDSMLQTAVLSANTVAGVPYAKLVRPAFQDMNAFAAPQSLVWLMPIPPTPPNLFDEMFAARQSICNQAQLLSNCRVASAGHPNAAGASMYANALIPAVSEYVPVWRAQFSMTSQLPSH